MERLHVGARPDWQAKVESVGCTYHSLGEAPGEANDGVYWHESHAYRFTAGEVDAIEAATVELHSRCLEAVDYLTSKPDEMRLFGLSGPWIDYVQQSWRRHDPSLMGRFDLAFDPATSEVKMLEYNADTPTLVIETSLVQWFWLQDRFPGADQFNSLHEKLLEALRKIRLRMPQGATLYFASLAEMPEENQHSLYFQDLATQVGISAKSISIERIGLATDQKGGAWFVDEDDREMQYLHKLYPWEWMRDDSFGPKLLVDRLGVVEPVWKMLLSNKALLPILWKLFPGHPHLLECFWEPGRIRGAWVSKPILAREGANIRLERPGQLVLQTAGSYTNSALIYQAAAELPVFDGLHVVIGSWVAGDEAAGMIVREGVTPIVTGTDRVVPHFFD